MYKHLTRKIHQDSVEIVENRSIGGEAWIMALRTPEIAERCRPGHFVMLTVEPDVHPVLPRPFSVFRLRDRQDRPLYDRPSEAPGWKETGIFWEEVGGFEVLYKVVGDGTERMAQKKPGDTMGVMGPCGDGLYAPALPGEETPSFVLMVAGGVGIVPLYFSAQELASRDVPHHLFFGGRGEEYLYDIDTFPPLGTQVHAVTEDGSRGDRGRVTDVLEPFLKRATADGVDGRPLESGAIYACGPEPMLRAVTAVADRFAMKSFLSLERRMGCAMGACRGCVVRVTAERSVTGYERVCTEGPVFPAHEIAL